MPAGVGETGDGVARRAAARVGGAEPHEKPADHDRDEALEGEERAPREHLARRQARQVVQPELLQCGDRVGRQAMADGGASCQAIAAPTKIPARNARFQMPSRRQSCEKYSMPHGATAAHTCAQVAGDPERLVPEQQQRRHHESDERSGDVPGQRVRKQVRHRRVRDPAAGRLSASAHLKAGTHGS